MNCKPGHHCASLNQDVPIQICIRKTTNIIEPTAWQISGERVSDFATTLQQKELSDESPLTYFK